jgi:tetratricopeptide (TPR) repeat protein
MQAVDLFSQALQAAQRGDRQQARQLLRQLTQIDPGNDQAWLWLSELETDLGEQVAALEQALHINPENSLAQARLERLHRRQARTEEQQDAYQERQLAQAQEWLEQARKALKGGQKQEALDLLLRYVQVDERNERAWLWLSELAPGLPDKIIALENVLTLNPANQPAQSRLEKLRRVSDNPLALGRFYEAEGDLENAINMYLQASMQARAVSQRLEARKRLELARIRMEVPDYKPVNPLLTLARLAAGPVLFYSGLLLIHSGLNPLRASWVEWLGIPLVLLGSTLATFTRNTLLVVESYAWWERWGEGQGALARTGLWLLGLVLYILPYYIILAGGFDRLEATIRMSLP